MSLALPPKARSWLRGLISLAVLAGLALLLDAGEIVRRLGGMRAGWVLAALALSVLQVLVSAWRWRFTAAQLGVDFGIGLAVREYYLASFVNQVMPGGVTGDVSRAWRQARSRSRAQESRGPAVRAVVLERASGQLVMGAAALASVLALPSNVRGPTWVWVTAALALALAFATWMRSRGASSVSRRRSQAGRLLEDARTAVFGPAVLPVQIASSLFVVGTYVATFLVAARAVGLTEGWVELAPLVAPVLMAMLLPISIAGWGLREGAAALLWGAAGLTMSEGVAVSVAYGLIVLLSTLPGLGVLLAGVLGAGRSRPEVEVEQDVGTQANDPAVGTEDVVEVVHGRQGQGGSTGSDQHGSDRDV